MQDFFDYSLSSVFGFMLVFIRVSGLCVISPLFGGEHVHKRVRILFALCFTLVLFPAVHIVPAGIPTTGLSLALLCLKELCIGLLIGFVSSAIFYGFQMGGQFIAVEMGLATGRMLDPFSNEESTAIGQFVGMFMMCIFLLMNGHHLILKSLAESFQAIPPLSNITFSADFYMHAIGIFNIVVVTALKVSLPMLAALFCINIVFGFIARLVPQMNVFVLALPAKIAVGIIILVVALPAMVILFGSVVDTVFKDLHSLLYFAGKS